MVTVCLVRTSSMWRRWGAARQVHGLYLLIIIGEKVIRGELVAMVCAPLPSTVLKDASGNRGGGAFTGSAVK